MKISGFTFVRNATKLYFPIKESIQSILPIVDEFIIAMGDNDEDDETEKVIQEIGSDKIKIIKAPWDVDTFPQNTEYARQTDIAKEACTGDWLFYLQSDEAIHEDNHELIIDYCSKYLENSKVDGFLLKYRHFWGDFDHYHLSHNWYPREIRIIRNKPEIHSWRDAQSFRYINNFKGSFEDYLRKENTEKLKVIPLDAYVFHYGCVRPPRLMSVKAFKMDESYHGRDKALKKNKNAPVVFDYGPMNLLEKFKGTHPSVMKPWIAKLDWHESLYEVDDGRVRPRHTHEKIKYRMLTFVEQKILGGNQIGGFKNYQIFKG